MRRKFLFLILLSFLGISLKSQAYDEDTHFYATYAMARYVGIRHEVAIKIALSAQWMDESFISDPTSMIILPITGVKKRRLLHFPSSRVTGQVNAKVQQSMLNADKMSSSQQKLLNSLLESIGFDEDINAVNLFTETEEDHPFASELFMLGLKKGNLMMCGASLHIIEDSFAHAGTPAEQGHASFWHWPDRPYASVEKYFRMVRAVMSALVAIRNMLPEEAIDCNLHLSPKNDPTPNCKMNDTVLADNYSKQSQVVATVSHDVLRDYDYIKTALLDLQQSALEQNYLTKDAPFKEALEKTYTKGIDARTALERVVTEVGRRQKIDGKEYIKIDRILEDMGRLKSANSTKIMDYVDSLSSDTDILTGMGRDGFQNLIKTVVYELLRWRVPLPLSDSHRMELEDDNGPIRKKEMEIRLQNMRNLVSNLYGIDLVFVPSNSKDDAGFAHEVWMDNRAEALPHYPDGSVYATFSLREKNLFDRMVFDYLFPHLDSDKDLSTIVNVGAKLYNFQKRFDEYLANRKAITEENKNFVVRKYKHVVLDMEYSDVMGNFSGIVSDLKKEIYPLAKPYLHDVLATRLTPARDNFYYRSPRLFEQYRCSNKIKTLLQEGKDVWTWQSLVAP